MSREESAPLTREEVVERLAKAVCTDDLAAGYPRWDTLVESERGFYRTSALAVLAELKALGLAVVPIQPTELMSNEGYDAACRTSHKRGIANIGAGDIVWAEMLASSPFAGN